MTTVTLIKDTDAITVDELRQLASVCKVFVSQLCPVWGMPTPKIQYSDHAITGTWNFWITDRNSMSGAYGYHTVENGIPVAYISPTICSVLTSRPDIHSGALWGSYAGSQPPFVFPGLASVLCHELGEALIDPTISTWKTDPVTNETWLVEVGDQANSGHYVMDVVTSLKKILWIKYRPVHQTVVFADVALPSFYDPNGKAPFTLAALLKGKPGILNSLPALVTKPFDHVKGCYAYTKDSSGARLTQFAKTSDLEVSSS